MTRDDITKLASEAGFEIGVITDAIFAPASCRSELERFAALVAAAELRRLHAENDDFRATCDHLIRENAGQIGEIVALKEQRDELLGLLKGVIEVADFHKLYGRKTDAARAAIAKAGGAA